MKKRLLSIVLALALCLGLLPAVSLTVSAADTGKAIQLGTGGISGYSSTNGYDYIYYGTWNSSPIQWRVLDDQTNTGESGLFLLSEARISFGAKSFRITVPFYVFSCGTCAALAGGIALGGLMNRLLTAQPSDPNLSALRLGLYLALAILALSRLAVLPGICGKYTEPPKKEPEKAEEPTAGESSIP